MNAKIILIPLLLFSSLANSQTISTIAGDGSAGYGGDNGIATNASIGYLCGVAVDSFGNVFIADANNQRIRKIDQTTGIITTIAGTGIAGYSGDGSLATDAQLNFPYFIVFDRENNIVFSDFDNSRVRKINLATGVITTIVGNGSAGFSGDGGPATLATLNDVSGIAFDKGGNLYLGDVGNFRVRKVNTSGFIYTVAGNGVAGYGGDDGPATAASFGAGVEGISTDVGGNVYIADESNHRVRRLNISTGTISTIAGNGSNAYAGDGIPATANGIDPFDLCFESNGDMLIADFHNSSIHILNSAGLLYKMVGDGVAGYSGDGGLATAAEINHPEGVKLDSCGNIYVADYANLRIRKVTYPTCGYLGVSNVKSGDELSLYPNPSNSTLNVRDIAIPSTFIIYDLSGLSVGQGKLDVGDNTINTEVLPPGLYLVAILDDEGNKTIRKFVKQ